MHHNFAYQSCLHKLGAAGVVIACDAAAYSMPLWQTPQCSTVQCSAVHYTLLHHPVSLLHML